MMAPFISLAQSTQHTSRDYAAAHLEEVGRGYCEPLRTPSVRSCEKKPAWCENSAGDGSIFMASGWLGKGHGSLLKNSLFEWPWTKMASKRVQNAA
jgi:hypothetical protein